MPQEKKRKESWPLNNTGVGGADNLCSQNTAYSSTDHVCICLVSNDVEHIFLCFLGFCICSLAKCLLKSFTHLKMGYHLLLNYCVLSMLHIRYMICNCFSPTFCVFLSFSWCSQVVKAIDVTVSVGVTLRWFSGMKSHGKGNSSKYQF